MRHLTDGTLRRLYDEPLAIPLAERCHLATCTRCRRRYAQIGDDARLAAGLLTGQGYSSGPPPTLAYRRLQQRLAADRVERQQESWQESWIERVRGTVMGQRTTQSHRLLRPLGSVAAAGALVGALALTPIGSLAQSVVTIFEPTQFTAVSVSTTDLQSLRALPDLSSFGTISQSATPHMTTTSSVAQAEQVSGLTIHRPATLPPSVPATVTYVVASRGTAAFTFSAARAQAAAQASGKALPPMPARVDGSTLSVSIGPIVVSAYGDAAFLMTGSRAAPAAQTVQGQEGTTAQNIKLKQRMLRREVAVVRHGASLGSFPALVIVQAPRPAVQSTGVTVRELEEYLLQQPGVSPSLAAEIRAIGDPTSTLPIPVPISYANAQTVQVQGVNGLAIGDNTGIASGVIWQKNGMVYAVAGALPESQVLAIANGLR